MKKNPHLQAGAHRFNTRMGLPPPVEGVYIPVNEMRAREIAEAYERLPPYDLSSLKVSIAYIHFAVEVCQQFAFVTDVLRIRVEPWDKPDQPYNNSEEMMADVESNLHLYIFSGGEPHDLIGHTDTTSDLTINEKFRAVHDLFGHAAEGYGFGPRGEENAWLKHSQMFTPLAQKALTTETRGQNCWFNFGKHNYDERGNRLTLSPSERPYPIQKIALLSDEYTDWRRVLAEATQ